jgi:O-acetyl-ADP-ribose deacetylase (regulator of RNase III)
MTIKVIKGDMVLSYKNKELDAYAHQCNCFNRMGRGIAPLLAKVNPEVREVDNSTIEGDMSKLGTFSKTPPSPVVYNIYGQYHWNAYKVAPNRNTDYNALQICLLAVKDDLVLQQKDVITLGLPLIGCGLAGGAWDNVVYPMICSIFNNTKVEVTIFVL